MSSQMSRLAAAGLAAASFALLVPSPSVAGTSTGSDTPAWCAMVINTKYGAMKNKHHLPGTKVPLKSQKAIVSAAVAQSAQILKITPAAIKKAMSDELTCYAHLKARNYASPASLAPFTIAEAGQLLDFQHAKCGITGP